MSNRSDWRTPQEKRTILLLAAALRGWHDYNASAAETERVSWNDWCEEGVRINTVEHSQRELAAAMALAFNEPVFVFPAVPQRAEGNLH